MLKQPPLGQIRGRGARIKATEKAFGMTCLDINGSSEPAPPPIKLKSSISMEDYEKLFHKVQ